MGFLRIGNVKFALSECRKRNGTCPVAFISLTFLVPWADTPFP
jgi:hypothetical protein